MTAMTRWHAIFCLLCKGLIDALCISAVMQIDIANVVCKYTEAWGPLLSMKNESDSNQIHHREKKKAIMPRAAKKKEKEEEAKRGRVFCVT